MRSQICTAKSRCKRTELVQCQKFAYWSGIIVGKKGYKYFLGYGMQKKSIALLGVKSEGIQKKISTFFHTYQSHLCAILTLFITY